MPLEMMKAAMTRLVQLPLARVQATIPQYACGVSRETTQKMVAALKRLAAIFQVLDDIRKNGTASEKSVRLNVALEVTHPCVGVVDMMWRVLDQSLEQCIADTAAMEYSCKVLKYAQM
jgi:hypothetical protein